MVFPFTYHQTIWWTDVLQCLVDYRALCGTDNVGKFVDLDDVVPTTAPG